MKIMFEGKEIEVTEEKAKELRQLLGIEKRSLADVAVGDTFCIGNYKFIKFSDTDGKTIAITKDILFESKFDKSTTNFAQSSLYRRLVKEVLPEIENIVGAENLCEFETDLFTADGLNIYGKMKSKISLPTFDFYRAHREIFDKYSINDWFWLSTANGENFVFCVAPSGSIHYCYSFCLSGGVRPFCILKSNIFVS